VKGKYGRYEKEGKRERRAYLPQQVCVCGGDVLEGKPHNRLAAERLVEHLRLVELSYSHL
jgi:hypothetical protein